MFKKYFKSIGHIIMFTIEMALVIALFVLLFISAGKTRANAGAPLEPDDPLIEALGWVLLVFFAFSIAFITDLIIYFVNKAKYKKQLKNSDETPLSPMDQEVKDKIETNTKNTEAYLANEAYLKDSKLLYERDNDVTMEDLKKFPLFRMIDFSFGNSARLLVIFPALAILNLIFCFLSKWSSGYTIALIVASILAFLFIFIYASAFIKARKAIKHMHAGKNKIRIYDNRLEDFTLNEDGSIKSLNSQIMFVNTTVKEDKQYLFIKGMYNNTPTIGYINKEIVDKEVVDELKNGNLRFTVEQSNVHKGAIILKSI